MWLPSYPHHSSSQHPVCPGSSNRGCTSISQMSLILNPRHKNMVSIATVKFPNTTRRLSIFVYVLTDPRLWCNCSVALSSPQVANGMVSRPLTGTTSISMATRGTTELAASLIARPTASTHPYTLISLALLPVVPECFAQSYLASREPGFLVTEVADLQKKPGSSTWRHNISWTPNPPYLGYRYSCKLMPKSVRNSLTGDQSRLLIRNTRQIL